MLASKNNQIILLYIIIIVFSIAFLIYFYKQASNDRLDVEVQVRQTSSRIIERGEKINLNLFKIEKFKKLKDIGAPTLKFEIGKRNPFEPY